jgi:tripartite-type tricarboxylate transporter receptor subunit TctC
MSCRFVPTVIEAGSPDATAAIWWGMAVSSGTPDAAIDALERLTTLGMLVPQETRAQFAASLKPEAELWAETIKRGNIKLE